MQQNETYKVVHETKADLLNSTKEHERQWSALRDLLDTFGVVDKAGVLGLYISNIPWVLRKPQTKLWRLAMSNVSIDRR